MKNMMNSELVLKNDQVYGSQMKVFADIGDNDLVGFIFEYESKRLTMRDEPIDGNGQEYFHLDKFNVGCLIDYLKRIYDSMDDAI